MVGQLVLIVAGAALLAIAFAVVVKRTGGTETRWRWWIPVVPCDDWFYKRFSRSLKQEAWLISHSELGRTRSGHIVIKNIT